MLVQPQLEDELKKWLVSAMSSITGPCSDYPIRHTLRMRYTDNKRSLKGDEDARLALSIIAKLRDLEPLTRDIEVKRALDGTPWLPRLGCKNGSRLLSEQLSVLWNEMIDAIYEHHWHAKQWAPSSLVVLQTPTRRSDPVTQDTKKAEKAQSSESAPSTSRLLDLPGEIRNFIWRLSVVQPIPTNSEDADITPIIIANRSQVYINSNFKTAFTPLSLPPGLLGVCQRIRSEASPFYYAENNFALVLDTREDFQATQTWLRGLRDEHLAHMSGVVLHGLVMQDRSPINFGSDAQSMRISIDFRSFTVRHEEIEGVDQSKELSVMKHTLANILQTLDEPAQLTRAHLRLLINNFALCCATSSGGAIVPLLSEGSQFDKLEAREEQEDFVESFCRNGKETARDIRVDLGVTRFSIW